MLVNALSNNSWTVLDSVYQNEELTQLIREFERKLNVKDETRFFAKLVNTSVSKGHPFHRWFRYREGYAGQLVLEILNRHPVNSKTEFVLDPMCGSGSTNIACQEANIDSVGLDVNPFAALATRIKCLTYEKSLISKIEKLRAQIRETHNKGGNATLNPFEKGILKYFEKRNLEKLSKLKGIIRQIKEKPLREFFFLALLAIVEDCSNRKKDGNGLATRLTNVSDVYKRFDEQLDIMIEDIKKPFLNKSQVYVSCKSAFQLSEEIEIASDVFGKKLASIIFSPPYANSFDYYESYKLEIVFGEYSTLEDLFAFRKDLIRNYRLSHSRPLQSDIKIVSLLCEEIWERIPEKELLTGIRDGRTRLVPNMLCAYFDDMRTVIQKSYHSLKSGGKVHIVVDQSSYVGVPIPTDLILAFIGQELGFVVESIIKCRRAATSGQQLRQYPYLKELLRESIVTLVK